MPRYVIHHRIDTLLQLWKPFEYDGFSFSAWEIDHQRGRHHGWLARKEIEGETIDSAFEHFSKRFNDLVDRIGFVGQCHTTADLEPFMITKPDDSRFFWRYAEKRNPVPLQFGENEIRSLEALERYNERGDVFTYLKEATNASTFYTMFAMLVFALEAMAGATDQKGWREIDRTYIATEILRDEELCKKIFKSREGIRNQIFHGGFVDFQAHGSIKYNEAIYDAIVDYFNDRHGLEIDTKARNRPRTVSGNYETWLGWCEWVSKETAIDLKLLNEKIRAPDSGKFYRIIEAPKDF